MTTIRRPAPLRTIPAALLLALALAAAACAPIQSGSGSAAAAPGARAHDARRFNASADQAAFQALSGARVFHGVHEGIHGPASYRIEVPERWNGVLVMYAHGYRGVGADLTVGNPAIRQYLVENGYAWAASSYSANYYDVRAGVEDTNALALAYPAITGLATPNRYYITGHSMGGHVAAAAIERETLERARSRVRYSGAVPMCGVMGDLDLPAYFVAFNYAAHQLAGFPPETFPLRHPVELLPEIKRLLWVDYDRDKAALTPQGQRLKSILMNLSGGDRPLFDEAFPTFMDQLLGYGTFEGSWNGIVAGDIVDTRGIVYRFEPGEQLTLAERVFNERIHRPSADRSRGNPARNDGVRWIPVMAADFDVPVVTIHTLGDLFVPFAMQQIYRRRAIERGSDRLLVQRAVRGPAHCQFNVQEEIAAFRAMVEWETEGRRPEGDDILSPAVVADPAYGCAFTAVDRPGMPMCPARGRDD
jgi:hypothetical protein